MATASLMTVSSSEAIVIAASSQHSKCTRKRAGRKCRR
jgi:hypothetical protein